LTLTTTPKIAKKHRNQKARIAQGVQSGELTKSEAHKLREGQREIRKDKMEAKSDGIISGKERNEIRMEQKQESKKIYRKKHN